jgi:hypothetical protein
LHNSKSETSDNMASPEKAVKLETIASEMAENKADTTFENATISKTTDLEQQKGMQKLLQIWRMAPGTLGLPSCR